jgi:hypothetical protein
LGYKFDVLHVLIRVWLRFAFKAEEEIEAAAKLCNDTVQWAGWKATPHSRLTKALD